MDPRKYATTLVNPDSSKLPRRWGSVAISNTENVHEHYRQPVRKSIPYLRSYMMHRRRKVLNVGGGGARFRILGAKGETFRWL